MIMWLILEHLKVTDCKVWKSIGIEIIHEPIQFNSFQARSHELLPWLVSGVKVPRPRGHSLLLSKAISNVLDGK